MSPDASPPPCLAGDEGDLGQLVEALRAIEQEALKRAEAGDYGALLGAEHAGLARAALAEVSAGWERAGPILESASLLDVRRQLVRCRSRLAEDSPAASSLDQALQQVTALRAYLP